MPLGLLGKKIGMTQIFDEKGTLIPVTLILAGPNYVVEKRNADRDGYESVQLGFDERPERVTNKPDMGRFKKASVPSCRFVREFRTNEPATLEIGQTLGVDFFQAGEIVDVVGTSKGRGFQGVYKRHKSKPGPASHGSMYFNRPGSNGGSSDPSRTYKGKPLPGHMGDVRVTVKNLEIVKCDPERNLLFVRGSVPGAPNGYVMVRKRKA